MSKCYKVYIYSDGALSGDILGYHTWVKIINCQTGDSYTYSYGAEDSGSFRDGEPADREARVPKYSGYITEAQFNAMREKGNDLAKNSPPYRLLQDGGDNCVSVTSLILEAAGINLLKGLLSPSQVINVIDILNSIIGGDDALLDREKYWEYMFKRIMGMIPPEDRKFSSLLVSKLADLATDHYFKQLDSLNNNEEATVINPNEIYNVIDKILAGDFNINDFIDSLVNTGFNTAANVVPRRWDPLIFDLDGDGIETVAADGSVLFDHNGDGVKYASGWAGADDALLVRDLDQNGQIDNGLELFGDNTIKANGEKATDGFDALSDLDNNNDGIFDHNDTAFDELRLWQDSNQDGVVQEGELKSLDDAGILSIDLNATNDGGGATGGVIAKKSTYNTVNGESFVVAALDFNANLFYREYHDDFNHQFAEELEAMDLAFNMQGSGAVRDLNQAALLNLDIANVVQSITQTNSYQQRKGLYQALVSAWAQSAEGFTSAITTLEGLVLESGAQISFEIRDETRQRLEKIAVLEAFNFSHMFDYAITENDENSEIRISIGNWSNVMKFNSNKDLMLNDAMFAGFPQQAPLINSAYDKLLLSVENNIFKTYDYQQLLDMVEFYIDDQEQVAISFEAVDQYFITNAERSAIDAISVLAKIKFMGSHLLMDLGWNVSQTLSDVVASVSDEEKQKLQNEPLVVNRETFSGAVLVEGSNIESLTEDNRLVLADDTSNTIYVDNDAIVFAGAGDDILYDKGGNAKIYGESGNDQLYALGSHAILSGGKGDDVIYAGGYNSLYIYNLGDGNDHIYGQGSDNSTLKLGEGIDFNHLDVTVESEQVIISIIDDKQQSYITYHNHLHPKTDDFIHGVNIALNSGAMIRPFGRDKRVAITGAVGNDHIIGTRYADTISGSNGDDYINGGDGDDHLSGEFGNDVLVGGYGKDYLKGGYGNDQYIINFEYGQDIIEAHLLSDHNSSNFDMVVFADGITAEDVRFSKRNDDLIITSKLGLEGSIKVSMFYNEGSSRMVSPVTAFMFSDGTVLTRDSEVLDSGKIMGTEYADQLYGNNSSENIFGYLGNDQLWGGNGDDYLYGGDGADVLYGDNGDDVLVGGLGHDRLSGGLGHDQYIFSIDHGYDVIESEYKTVYRVLEDDIVVFEQGIDLQDTYFTKNRHDLIVSYGASDAQIIIEKFYAPLDSPYQSAVNKFVFFDGTIIDRTHYLLSPSRIKGTDGDDTLMGAFEHEDIFGYSGDDILMGLDGNDMLDGGIGNDRLIAGAGDDTLIGGKGNDYLYGETGHNRYVFSAMDGEDKVKKMDFLQETTENSSTLVFNEGIQLSDFDQINLTSFSQIFGSQGTSYINTHIIDLIFSSQEKGLNITLVGYGMIKDYDVNNQKYSSPTYLEFNNGSERWQLMPHKAISMEINGEDKSFHNSVTLTHFDEVAQMTHIKGIGRSEYLQGTAGNDILDGGGYHDYLAGGLGADRYVLSNLSFNDDVIIADETNTEDAILLKDVSMDELYFLRDNDDLYVKAIPNHFNQAMLYQADDLFYRSSMKLSGYFKGLSVATIIDSEGNTHSIAELLKDESKYSAINDNLNRIGSKDDDYIESYAGDDVIHAKAGNNWVDAGQGNNTITAGNGNDRIAVGEGDNSIRAGHGENDIETGDGNNDIRTGSDNDTIYVGEGDNVIKAGHGENSIQAGSGNNQIYGGANYDYVYVGDGNNLIKLGNGDNELDTGDGDNVVYAGSGDDSVNLGDGNNTVKLGRGDNQIYAYNGDNIVITGAGDDYIELGDGNNVVRAGHGDNEIDVGDGDNQIYTGNGDDIIYTYDGDNVIKASHGDNEIYVGNGDNMITSGNGDDLIEVQTGQNTIRSGAGDDVITVEASASHKIPDILYPGQVIDEPLLTSDDLQASMSNKIYAGAGDDSVYSGDGSDLIYAGKGDDVIYAGGGNDKLYAQLGDNSLYGESGDDTLYAGNDGQDQLFGGQGDDTLRAKNGDDLLEGQEGDDTLIAHGDNNTLSGGDGSDYYQVNFKNANNTVINNYDSDGSSDFMKLNGVKTTDLRFYREVSNLMIKNLADKDKPKEIVVQDWFESEDHQIDEIGVGKFVLSNKQIDVIIQTLASFNVETGVGEDLLNKDQQDEIKSTLANAWMPKSA
ncbi:MULTISPECIES: calcium-binding protein [Cysteiniphilum]|uniref:calcium-binding protein n=1 Tax=Cysteiniphilum TaxID=2056696 RepID=UPI00177D6B8A|nr:MULTISPECIES: calcium-binding protein [Cysteiniphilum]